MSITALIVLFLLAGYCVWAFRDITQSEHPVMRVFSGLLAGGYVVYLVLSIVGDALAPFSHIVG
jgi:hypothetical protein